MFKHGLLKSRAPLLEMGIASETSFQSVLDELEEWPVGDTDYYALSRQVQISGERIYGS
jgi:hypothetical protein